MIECDLVGPGSDNYPEGLLDLEEPPSVYVAGALRRAPAVAVVGTRRCTRYGVLLAEAFGAALSDAGWTVVSGLARGVDSAAHRGTLEAGGHPVAVLGSGVDIWYPAENRPLYRRVCDGGGALVSEYPPGTPPERWRFPARNRLIAAMSSAVVVVEAGARGGALITARLAAEIGRPVLVVPGDVDRPASVGCNRLIRDGAHPVLGADDLIEELSLLVGTPPATREAQQSEIPDTGTAIDDLPALWGCSLREALARLGRLESAGSVVRVGETIRPARGE